MPVYLLLKWQFTLKQFILTLKKGYLILSEINIYLFSLVISTIILVISHKQETIKPFFVLELNTHKREIIGDLLTVQTPQMCAKTERIKSITVFF